MQQKYGRAGRAADLPLEKHEPSVHKELGFRFYQVTAYCCCFEMSSFRQQRNWKVADGIFMQQTLRASSLRPGPSNRTVGDLGEAARPHPALAELAAEGQYRWAVRIRLS